MCHQIVQVAVKEAKEYHELNTLPEGFLKPTPGTVTRDDKRVADQRKEVFTMYCFLANVLTLLKLCLE